MVLFSLFHRWGPETHRTNLPRIMPVESGDEIETTFLTHSENMFRCECLCVGARWTCLCQWWGFPHLVSRSLEGWGDSVPPEHKQPDDQTMQLYCNLNSNWLDKSFEIERKLEVLAPITGEKGVMKSKRKYEEQVRGRTLGCADQEASTSTWWLPEDPGPPLPQDLGVSGSWRRG